MKLLHGRNFNNFSKNQKFFLDCWFNMIQNSSLDTHRVRVMNPCNILQELNESLFGEHTNKKRISLIYDELMYIFKNDSVISSNKSHREKIENITLVFNKLRDNEEMIGSWLLSKKLHDFHNELFDSYHIDCIDYFIENLNQDTEIDKDKLQIQLSNFLSFLMYRNNQDTGSFFVYLFNIFLKSRGSGELNQKLKLLKRILTETNKFRCTLFKIYIDKEMIFPIEDINSSFENIKFFGEIDKINDFISTMSNKIAPLSKQEILRLSVGIDTEIDKRLVFCIYISNDIDGKVAGNTTYSIINDVLDSIVLETEHSIKVDENFYFIKDNDGKLSIIEHKIDNYVPSPPKLFLEDLNTFTSSILNSRKNSEFINSIKISLKFYRQGEASSNLSDKMLNWWTALEQLTVNKKGNVGDIVSDKISIVISNKYVKKQLDALMIFINSELFKEIDMELPRDKEELMNYLMKNQRASSNSDYVNFYIEKLQSDFNTETKIKDKIRSNKKKVSMNLYRIYRARCSIVHNAKPTLNLLLLCSNLKEYLKTLIISMLFEYIKNKDLTIDEFFLNQELLFDKITDHKKPLIIKDIV